MNKHVKRLSIFAALAFALVPTMAFAQPPTGMGGSNDASKRPNMTKIREQAEARAQEIRTNVEERRAEIKQRVEERRAEVKAKVCERRQEQLEKIIPHLSQGATSVKSSIDTMYTRVAGFYESGQLTVENYEELVGEIEIAKANSEAAITAIEDQSFTLDCENPNVGEQLDGYRLAVREAKETLKSYRDSLVELISAMRAAASTGDQSSGGDSDATVQPTVDGSEESGNE